MDLKKIIDNVRGRIIDDHYEFQELWPIEKQLEYLDDFITSTKYSDLEKAFFLMLNQFPTDSKDYIVLPQEFVLVSDVYDRGSPGIEYEIDFAIYGGSIFNPVKVAIECDGIRSHRQKHSNKDRRKDVNLQAAGWIVIRFGSSEIHEELMKFENEENYVCSFLLSIENVIQEKVRLITKGEYGSSAEVRSILTGYKWGDIECKRCNNVQMGRLNHRRHKCSKCGEKFVRDIGANEIVKYEHNGILYF